MTCGAPPRKNSTASWPRRRRSCSTSASRPRPASWRAKTELFNLRFQAATGQLESHGRLRAVRKEIARIYTVKRERELGIVTFADEMEDGAEEAEDSE